MADQYTVTYGPNHPVFGNFVASGMTKATAIREARRMARAYDEPASVRTDNGELIASFQRRSIFSRR